MTRVLLKRMRAGTTPKARMRPDSKMLDGQKPQQNRA
jgi:hypothetical protein